MIEELAAWLTQIYDQDQADAEACNEVYPSPWDLSDRGYIAYVTADAPHFWRVVEMDQDQEQNHAADGWLGDRLRHIVHQDPATVLARIEAHRKILALHVGIASYPEDCGICNESVPCTTVRLIGEMYADRPGYQEVWRP